MDNGAVEAMVTDDKEVDAMPAIESVECERVSYIKEMEEYLSNLKQMSDKEARKRSRSNLIRCNIIQENGEFTEQYKDEGSLSELLTL